MLFILGGLTLFTIISAAAAAFQGNGIYRIHNNEGNTVFRSGLYGVSCFVTNQTSNDIDFNELWLARDVRPVPGIFTFQNLAHQAFVTVGDNNTLTLRTEFSPAFYVSSLGDGSYSIRDIENRGPGPNGWEAQPPIRHGDVKMVNYSGQHASQKWKFTPVLV